MKNTAVKTREKYDFVENEDFTILKNGNGSNAFIEYIVTLVLQIT